MPISDPLPLASRRPKRPSMLSIVVWGVIGLVAGVVIGGLAVEVSGPMGVAGATVNVRVEVLGVTVRQGVGPESLERVAWTWGISFIAVFAFIGAGIAVAWRCAASRLWWAVRGTDN